MNRMQMSGAAAGLLRALLGRVGEERDRILLMECTSVDWQSLTFIGERHRYAFRIVGPDAEQLATRFSARLGEEDFRIRGQVVADIAAEDTPESGPDGSILVRIEALTITE